eukprot:CAMPEP_0179351224 /NCGR_PEP_ID=MMETSP0797-20121207/75169_1 /TAXON_ID=47934 /ORGANISM="Dinophysis acuminata, Strain DAEP01" /LENGTH=92 /DNA_ID=CAMNT_0021066177 /DNA_START=198 /DNA_END=473 /DNA_ORIENTATION=+
MGVGKRFAFAAAFGRVGSLAPNFAWSLSTAILAASTSPARLSACSIACPRSVSVGSPPTTAGSSSWFATASLAACCGCEQSAQRTPNTLPAW